MMTIEQARADVHRAFASALNAADSETPKSLWAFEQQAWMLMLALGRALVVLFLVRQVARARPSEYWWDGKKYTLDGSRETPLGTRFGKVSFRRPVGRRRWQRRAKADLVVDRELGLCSGFSLGVVVGMARLCAQMAYANARSTWCDVYEWAPSPRAVMRMVDAMGDQASSFMKQAPAPKDDGEVLVIQVDGGGAPMISHQEGVRRRRPKRQGSGTRRARRRARRRQFPRPRRKKGNKSKNAKVAFAAVLYTLRRTDDGVEGPINKRIIATFESHRALFELLRVEAEKRGYGCKQTIFLADGSEHIWSLQQELLPDVDACLDWYHLAEYLWSAGRSFLREGSPALRRWVDAQKTRLRNGKIDEVIAEMDARLNAIPKTGPGNKGRRKRLATALGYVRKHRERMPYQAFLAAELDIGSGAIEGCIRNLIRMRLDGPGMRWSRQRSERVLHLRCVLLSNQWGDFTEYIAEQEHLRLPAQPEPTRTHDAKKAA